MTALIVDLEQIKAACEMIPEAGCWIWMGRTNKEGYGRIHPSPRDKNPSIGVHRLSYALANGLDVLAIPRTLCVRHRCDTPICVNPDHLILGTWKENVHDAKNRGRHAVAFQEVDGEVAGTCKNGHDLRVVGVYDHGIQQSGYRLRVCHACKKARSLRYARKVYIPHPRKKQ